MADTKIVPLYPTDTETASIYKWADMAAGAQQIAAVKGMTKADIALVALRGFELGLGFGHALDSIYVVNGRTSMSAELMRDRARSAGYRIDVVSEDAEQCTVVIYHHDEPEYRHEEKFAMEDAKRADLIKDRGNWKKWPKQMLRARATTNAIRWFAPQVLAGCLERTEAEEIPEAFTEPRVLSAEDVDEAEQRGKDFIAAHTTLDLDTVDEINAEMTRIIRDAELDRAAKTELGEEWEGWKKKKFGVNEMGQIPAAREPEVRRWVRRLGERLGVAVEGPGSAEGDAEAEQAQAPAPAESAESPEAAQDGDEDIQEGEYEEPEPAAEPEPGPAEDTSAAYNTEAWTAENIPMAEFSPWLADHYKADAQPALFEAAGVNENHISKLSEPQRYKVFQYVSSQAPAQGDLFGDEEGK